MNTKILLFTLALGFMAMGCKCGVSNQSSVPLKTQADSVAYFLGYMNGMSLMQEGMTEKDLSQKAYLAGINAALQGKEVAKDEKEQMQIGMMIRSFFQKIVTEQAKENLEKGEAFLKENAKKAGVDTLAGGVQYKVLKAGDGPKPTANEEVKVAYVGKLIDGKVFNSRLGEEAVTFGVSQVIPGWTEALKNMAVGSKWEIYVPSNMAYGPRPNGPIPANSTLIFEMELLSIVPVDTTAQPVNPMLMQQ